jgi:hypothetical protein
MERLYLSSFVRRHILPGSATLTMRTKARFRNEARRLARARRACRAAHRTDRCRPGRALQAGTLAEQAPRVPGRRSGPASQLHIARAGQHESRRGWSCAHRLPSLV